MRGDFQGGIILRIVVIAIVVIYAIFNIIMANQYSAKEMYDDIIVGQCPVGKFCANIFYLPAWALKGLRAVILATVK